MQFQKQLLIQQTHESESSNQTRYERKHKSQIEKTLPQNLNPKRGQATLSKLQTTKKEKSLHNIRNKLQTPTV
jgi:hypothetical protein